MIKRLLIAIIMIFPFYESSAQPSNGRAVSLKMLQKKMSACMPKRQCSKETLHLFGLKKILGYVADKDNSDIIIIGETDASAPDLFTEDFIIALRNVWLKYADLKGNTYYYSSPGCSIDPDPKVLMELQQVGNMISAASDKRGVNKGINKWRKTCGKPQTVRVMGIPFNSHFAKVMVDADYYMKRLVDGSVTLDIKGFKSLPDMTIDLVRTNIDNNEPVSIPSRSTNRFWFYPGKNLYLKDKGIVMIDKSEVILLTEEEFQTKDGKLIGAGRPDPMAKKFATNFSMKYKDISVKKPIYKELEDLFRFVAITKLMKENDAVSESNLNIDYLLAKFPVRKTPVPSKLSGLSNVKKFSQRTEMRDGYKEFSLNIPTCGGVTIDININKNNYFRDKRGNLSKLRALILKSRPSKDLIFWSFTVN